MTAPEHVPVLLSRIVELFTPVFTDRDGVLVDATVGLGGHSDALLEAFPRLRLVALDRDPAALEKSAERLARHGDRVDLVHTVYDGLPEALEGLKIAKADGILFDLGVSSMQLDRAERGFAYSKDSPLDMRMDPTTGFTAADVLNTYAPGELIRILRDYGEERFAQRIVKAVVAAREKEPFTTSGRLVELLYDAVPAATRRTGGHPAKRTFQALRIEVNAELATLESVLPSAVAALAVGGRIAVLAYHSLEDRLVKQVLAAGAANRAPRDLPVVPAGMGPELRLLTRGADRPGADEAASNPRAASARLRAAVRIDEPGRPGRARQEVSA